MILHTYIRISPYLLIKILFQFQTYGPSEHFGKTMGQRYVELVKARNLASGFVGPDNKIIEPGKNLRPLSRSAFNPPESPPNDAHFRFQEGMTNRPRRCPYICPECKGKLDRPKRFMEHLINSKCLFCMIEI